MNIIKYANVLQHLAAYAAICVLTLPPIIVQAQAPNTAEVQKATLLNVIRNLKENHISPKAIDDNFSKMIWKKFLENLDPNKDVFLKSDFEKLRSYELLIDDELNNGMLTFFNAAFGLYQQRLQAAAAGYSKVLAAPFDFSVTESLQLNGKLRQSASTQAELDKLWEQRAKYLVLKKMMDLNKGKMTSPALEQEARSKVARWVGNTFKNLMATTAQKDKFSQFLNTVTLAVEAHTVYFPPLQAKSVNARMAKRFFGIGVELQDKEGDFFIKSLRPGGVALSSGLIDVNDRIISVSNTSGEQIDVIGKPILEVADLVKGDKDTEVSLGLLKASGQQKVVTLKRAEVNEEESKARSAIVRKDGRKIGYLYLREFYVDVNDAKGARAAVDVQTEILKLKDAKVEGIVFDLRDNPGGSIDEVVDIAGFFLGPGPKVLVKEMNALYTPTTDKKAIYTGPLVVMVNEHSGSASELFAAAIQDHKRGLIIGAPATFGKGTAQPTLPMGKMGNKAKGIPNISYGAIRISQYRFYRVTGASTQLRGVASDVVLPGKLAYLESREKNLDSALPWDSISPANYKPYYDAATYNKVKKLGQEAVGELDAFKVIDENSKLLSEQQLKPVSLKPLEFVKEQQALAAYSQKIEDMARLPQAKRLKVTASPGYEGAGKKWYPKWTKEVSADIYVDKTLDVINRLMMLK
ncbi:carboxyl-terminal processing protease [Pedobacter africanus]|uniref:Carboxyl-terminal processing protease n=1 Tax=Pedobacter africanus TaxID=151894 RepID=A0ACC6L1B4_9SPHI|nr:carboxy terminal-processing peptidase [Pedobacter africanus]MDR6785394.1 carboxyl-terminal processing protease [Pedobacter africanus]